jgi:DNA-directed RNA polymerase subunit F
MMKIAGKFDMSEKTSKKVASKAAKLLNHEDADVRSVAASALTQAENESSTPLAEAVKVLTTALKRDPELYYCYQSNIACSILDEFKDLPLGDMDYHKFANDAAKRFLDLLIGEQKEK